MLGDTDAYISFPKTRLGYGRRSRLIGTFRFGILLVFPAFETVPIFISVLENT